MNIYELFRQIRRVVPSDIRVKFTHNNGYLRYTIYFIRDGSKYHHAIKIPRSDIDCDGFIYEDVVPSVVRRAKLLTRLIYGK